MVYFMSFSRIIMDSKILNHSMNLEVSNLESTQHENK